MRWQLLKEAVVTLFAAQFGNVACRTGRPGNNKPVRTVLSFAFAPVAGGRLPPRIWILPLQLVMRNSILLVKSSAQRLRHC